jgi:hypothetical protein
MQHYIFKKNLLPLVFLFIMVSVAAGIFSCKNGKQSLTNSTSVTCVRLTKDQLQQWVNAGYTDSTKPNYIVAVRIKTAYAGPGTEFRVYAVGQRKDGSLIDSSLTELNTADSCGQISLSEFVFTGSCFADFKKMHIWKPNGTVNDSLKYIKLTPYSYSDTSAHIDLLAYNAESVGIPTGFGGNMKSTLPPCPPCPSCTVYCPPGCNGKCGTGSVDSL